jgi:predicted MFS family arabinose efflux permease
MDAQPGRPGEHRRHRALRATGTTVDTDARVTERPASISRGLVLVMATATGVTVAKMYFAQPLLPAIRSSLHLGATVAGLLVTVSQIGYAIGLIFLLPLGDLLERRRLICGLSAVCAVALLALAFSPDAPWLLVASLAVGGLSALAQILVPFAAGMAADHERGRVVGMVMTGLLLGILLARTVAGLVAAAGGWRAIYVVAAVLMAVQAVALREALPRSTPAVSLPYRKLLRSVVSVARQEPVLRHRALLGCLTFGAFSVLWTSLAFLLAGAPYHYGSAVIGLFGLVGAAGALAATMAGRLADRGHAAASTRVTAALLLLCWLPMWFGHRSVVALIVGILVLDFATQGMQVTNQSLIYRLNPQARSRINSAYMTVYFAGGAAGSALSAVSYDKSGWAGVCWVGAGFGVAVLVAALLPARQSSDSADAEAVSA